MRRFGTAARGIEKGAEGEQNNCEAILKTSESYDHKFVTAPI